MNIIVKLKHFSLCSEFKISYKKFNIDLKTYVRFLQNMLSMFHKKNPKRYNANAIINIRLQTLHLNSIINLISCTNEIATSIP